jgi:hypothetical protein
MLYQYCPSGRSTYPFHLFALNMGDSISVDRDLCLSGSGTPKLVPRTPSRLAAERKLHSSVTVPPVVNRPRCSPYPSHLTLSEVVISWKRLPRIGPSDGRQLHPVGSPVRDIQRMRFDAFALLNADRVSVLRSRQI